MDWGMRYASPFPLTEIPHPSPLIALPLTISKAWGWSIHNFLHVTSHNQQYISTWRDAFYRPTWRHPLNPGKEILKADKLFSGLHPESFKWRGKCRHFLPYDFAVRMLETLKVNDTGGPLTHEYRHLVWNSIETRKGIVFRVMYTFQET
jgi:hypothetical protein